MLRRKFEGARGLEYDVNSDCAIVHCMQGSAKWWTLGFEIFVSAVACHFCLNLPEQLSQPRAHLLEHPCRSGTSDVKFAEKL